MCANKKNQVEKHLSLKQKLCFWRGRKQYNIMQNKRSVLFTTSPKFKQKAN